MNNKCQNGFPEGWSGGLLDFTTPAARGTFTHSSGKPFTH
jgi:hypothetical protein